MMLEPWATDAAPRCASLHLVEEMCHRAINDYAEAICSLSIAERKCPSELAQEHLANTARMLGAHAQLYRTLLPPYSIGVLNLGDYIGGLARAMLDASLEKRGVNIVLRTDEVELEAQHCWRLGLIIAELIRNACRHGFSGGAGTVTIDIIGRTASLICSVEDDGKGISESRPGRGRHLMQLIASELGGRIAWAGGTSGTRVELSMPRTMLLSL